MEDFQNRRSTRNTRKKCGDSSGKRLFRGAEIMKIESKDDAREVLQEMKEEAGPKWDENKIDRSQKVTVWSGSDVMEGVPSPTGGYKKDKYTLRIHIDEDGKTVYSIFGEYADGSYDRSYREISKQKAVDFLWKKRKGYHKTQN